MPAPPRQPPAGAATRLRRRYGGCVTGTAAERPFGEHVPSLEAASAGLAHADTTAEALRVIIDAGRTLVPNADLVSVTIRTDDGTFDTAAASEPLAVRLDELQYRLQEGPCVLASRRGGLGVFTSADVETDPLISSWGPAAAEHRVRSVLSVGLYAHQDPPRVGAVNFMSFARGGLDTADRDVAVVLAAHTAAVLEVRAEADAAAGLDANLRDALRNRDIIGQAKGILVEREGIDEDKAFALLRSVSQRMNVKLSEIARTITTRRSDL